MLDRQRPLIHWPGPTITDSQRAQFRDQGYVVVPGAITDAQLAAGRVPWSPERSSRNHRHRARGFHFLWPRFEGEHASAARLSIGTPARQTSRAELIRPDVDEPDFAQIATTIPPWSHRPGGPHVDGVSPLAPDGTPYTFSMLAGVWLSDQEEQYHGNLHVWPGTHLRFGDYLASEVPTLWAS